MKTQKQRHNLRVFFLALTQLMCSPKKQKPCSETQVVVSEQGQSTPDRKPKAPPLGGFIHIGPRSCTTTLSLKSANNSALIVNAYSALHCFREDLLNEEQISLSIFIPHRNQSKAGYIKNIPAEDEFFERRKKLIQKVDTLGKPFVSEQMRRFMRIELPYFFDDRQQVINSTNPEDRDKLLRNICLANREDRLSVPNSQETCWSSLDTVVRTLEIKAAAVEPKRFALIRRAFEEQSERLQSLLRKDQSIAKNYQLWSNRIHGLTGLWRLTNYSSLAYFLNRGTCSLVNPASEEAALCLVREQLIELAKNYLIEIDSDGVSKSILSKANELGFGLDQDVLKEKKMELVNLMPKKAFDNFHEVFLAHRNDIKQRIKVQDNKIQPLDPEYIIAANESYLPEAANTPAVKFSLFGGQLLTPENTPIFSKGMSSKGTLRFYVNKDHVIGRFGKSDSGTLLTYAGIVPLLVLNSVDDEPTSGGASILALPEALPEDASPPATGSQSSCR
jgi:hypothetical protein